MELFPNAAMNTENLFLNEFSCESCELILIKIKIILNYLGTS